MSALATLGGVGVSLAAFGYLAATDPKRRRVFRLAPATRRRPRLAWAIALLPGLALPVIGGAGAFFVWLGAVSVAGWAVAAVSPTRAADWAHRLREASVALRRAAAPIFGDAERRARAAVASLRPAPRVSPIADLERRVAELEAEVARLRGGSAVVLQDDDHVVVDLARRR